MIRVQIWIRKKWWRIRETQKHTDPDPQHWLTVHCSIVSQRYGSADQDPDPYQNVKDPQHCLKLWTLEYFFLSLVQGLYLCAVRRGRYNLYSTFVTPPPPPRQEAWTHVPNIYKEIKPLTSAFLKNWPVKVLGGTDVYLSEAHFPPMTPYSPVHTV